MEFLCQYSGHFSYTNQNFIFCTTPEECEVLWLSIHQWVLLVCLLHIFLKSMLFICSDWKMWVIFFFKKLLISRILGKRNQNEVLDIFIIFFVIALSKFYDILISCANQVSCEIFNPSFAKILIANQIAGFFYQDYINWLIIKI